MEEANPYKSTIEESPPRKTRYSTRSMVLVIAFITMASVFGIGLAYVQTKFRAVVTDFDVELSLLSEWCLSPVAPVFVASILLMAALRELIYPSRYWFSIWNVALMAFLIASLVVVLNGLLLPLINLVMQLQ